LRILVKNHLSASSLPPEVPHPPENFPHGYAVTNLHTHGLHVSPSGQADDIYVEIKPGKSHEFE
jgi:L-ascorbate oxidase